MINSDEIISKAMQLGYHKCGIVNIGKMKGYAEKLTERIDRFPRTKPYLEEYYEYSRLQDKYPWVKSVVICARWYGKYQVPANVKGHIGKYFLTDNRRDENSKAYQDSVAFERYLISSGIRTLTERDFGIAPMRWAAMEAGIGIFRKNNFIFTEKGSWLNLEAFLIDQEMEYIHENEIKTCPENCNLCVEACPTKSLAEPFMMNRSTCVTCLTMWEGWDLTTEKKSSKMESWIFGCDACQDVCPFNHSSWTEEEDYPLLTEFSREFSLTQIVDADYKYLTDVVQPKLWSIPKDKVWRYKTNALNAMLNQYNPEYLPYIRRACNDTNENVRNMASWVLSRL